MRTLQYKTLCKNKNKMQLWQLKKNIGKFMRTTLEEKKQHANVKYIMNATLECYNVNTTI